MKIMVCYDGSEDAKEGVREAVKHAKAFDALVLLVTSVSSDNKYYPEKVRPIEEALKDARSCFDQNKIPCETHISYRAPDISAGEDLVLFASNKQVDEIIVGIKRRSKVGKFLLGSDGQWVILKAECPVVGVKGNALAAEK